MKISELFSKKEAATFAAEPIDPRVLPGPEECNCADLFLGNEAAEIKAQAERGTLNKTQFHKNIYGRILDVLFRTSDRSAAKETLAQMKRRTPAANEEWERHLLMHADGAGISHRDHGIKDTELGKKYVQGRSLALNATQNVGESDYDENNCGPCGQYLETLKGLARKYQDELIRRTDDLPPEQKPYGVMSARGLFQQVWDNWTKRNPHPEVHGSFVEQGNRILSDWEKHSADEHGVSLDPYKSLVHTPVVDDTDGSKLESVYKEFEGASNKADEDAEEAERKLNRQIAPYFPPVRRDTGYEPDMSLYYAEEPTNPDVLMTQNKAREIGQNLQQQGLLSMGVEPFGGRQVEVIQTPKAVSIRNLEGRNFTYNRQPRRDITRRDVAPTPSMPSDKPAETRPEIIQTWTNYKTDKGGCSYCKGNSTQCNGWHADDMSEFYAVPREDAYLFQMAGMKPKVKDYKMDLWRYQNQPTHEITGYEDVPRMEYKTKEVERPAAMIRIKMRSRNGVTVYSDPFHENAEDPVKLTVWKGTDSQGVQRQWLQSPEGHRFDSYEPVTDEHGNPTFHPTEKVKEHVTDIESGPRPVLNEDGTPVVDRNPIITRIPEERRIPEPKSDYESQYNQALEIAYPGMPREEALGALREEHQARIKPYTEKQVKTTSYKKEDIMSSFNSRYAGALSDITNAVINHVSTHGTDGLRQVAHHVMDYAMGDRHSTGPTGATGATGPSGFMGTPCPYASDHQMPHDVQLQACDQWRDQQINKAVQSSEQSGGGGNLTFGNLLEGIGALTVGIPAMMGIGHLYNKGKDVVRSQLGIGGQHTRPRGQQAEPPIDPKDPEMALRYLEKWDREKKQGSFSSRFAAEKKGTPCEKCGKHCANKVECKSNQDDRRRQQAADSAFND